MKLQEKFKNVFSYAAGMEDWVRKYFLSVSGYKLEYTFVNDFAIADWYGMKDVLDTYKRVVNEWGKNYKAFTEAIMCINMLAWAHNQLRKQGIEGREPFIDLYSDLYYEARDKFYEIYKDNEKAKDYFFEMTD